jgi:hypothetical protein
MNLKEITMNKKMWTLLVAVSVFALVAPAQESVRNLEGPGQHNKFLTPGQLDRWVFEGQKGETIVAHVATNEFDPVLELAAAQGDKEDKVLMEVDDPGGESRFSFRLPEKGQYKIRIHGFKRQGGGNYTLQVRRFQAMPLGLGKPSLGTFDQEGHAYHWFQAVRDQILIPDVKGPPGRVWKMLDIKGREMSDWNGTVLVQQSGEHSMVLSGQPGQRYELLVREARRQDLSEGQEPSGNLQQGEMDVWSFSGKPGDFRVLEVEKKGQVASRLIGAPQEKTADSRLAQPGERPEISLLPVASRGGRLRWAAILGREGKYQFHLLAITSTSYKLKVRDPSVAIEWGREVKAVLPVAGSAFYSLKTAPGQLLEATAGSQQFVPLLRLYDSQGRLAGSSGEITDTLEGRITHMAVAGGLYHLQVSSVGDGGGGEFRLALVETKLKDLQMGGRGQATLASGGTDFWAFPGKEGQIAILSVRSSAFDPVVDLRSPEGVRLASENRGGADAGKVFAVKLPKTGRYILGISSRRGAGEYSIRLIDGN